MKLTTLPWNWWQSRLAEQASGTARADDQTTSAVGDLSAGGWQGTARVLLATGLLLAKTQGLLAQAGTLDVSFNPGQGTDWPVWALALQPDGHVVVGGEFSTIHGHSRNGIARLNPNGSVDTTFNPGTGVTGCVFTVALQLDGKIVLGGDFDSVNGAAHDYVARLGRNGSVDATFDIAPDDVVYSLVYSPSGQILLAGDFTAIDKGPSTYFRNYVAKITTNGTVTSWNSPGTDELDGPDFSVWAMAVQPDGKVVIGGDFSFIINGSTDYDRSAIARLKSSDGNLDTTFTPGGGADSTVYAVALQPDGKMLIGGNFTNVNGSVRFGIARLNANGSVDPTFDPGLGTDGDVLAIAVQGDGKIVIGGDFATVGGQPRFGLARLDSHGQLDLGFNAADSLDGFVYAIALQPDGQILIGGDFTYVGDVELSGIARINGDQAPTIQVQPVAQRAQLGSQATFRVNATGLGPLSYQWYADGQPLLDDGHFRGTQSPVLTLSNVDSRDEAVFTVSVSNPAGAVLSAEADLEVNGLRFVPGSFAYANGAFRFTVAAGTCEGLVIEASTNLTHWVPIHTNLNPGAVSFSDPAAGLFQRRFYRAICR